MHFSGQCPFFVLLHLINLQFLCSFFHFLAQPCTAEADWKNQNSLTFFKTPLTEAMSEKNSKMQHKNPPEYIWFFFFFHYLNIFTGNKDFG